MGVDLYLESHNAGSSQAGAFHFVVRKIRLLLRRKAERDELTPTETEILSITNQANKDAHWMWKDEE